MEEIYDTNDSFNFEKLILSKPTSISGGNYFIRCLINNTPLYIQPPKCKTKQGILKAGKRYYTDLMFTNENEHFIRWMENLENHCQKFIYKNREKWFDGEMDLHDIENYFTSPLKTYKSGKYYIARTIVPSILGKITLKIYDENEKEYDTESIDDSTDIMTIIEIQGIKCSARSFQIDLEIKQIMKLKPSKLFEKCIIKGRDVAERNGIEPEPVAAISSAIEIETKNMDETGADSGAIQLLTNVELPNENVVPDERILNQETSVEETPSTPQGTCENTEHFANTTSPPLLCSGTNQSISEVTEPEIVALAKFSGVTNRSFLEMEEVEFNLEELPQDKLQLKKRNDVYYEMYQEARKKAKIARDLAISSYLEAKRIKNTYLLDDIDSEGSDGSDLDENDDLINDVDDN